MTEPKKYEKIVREFLSDKRYRHSLCVAKEAVRLAQKYGASPEKAETAGILHDIMKEAPAELQLKIIADFGILLSDVEKVTEKLWHQTAAMAYVNSRLGITDGDILNAIRYHTSGRKDMSLLEKVVFIADFTSEDRDYEGVDEMRSLAEESLESAMACGIAFVIKELAELQKPIIRDSIEAYNQAVTNMKES